MTDTMDLGSLCEAHTAELVDSLVDYCIRRWGGREGAIRALAAVGVGAEQCTSALPHAAHLGDGCPGLALDEYVAAGGILPLRASAEPDDDEPDEAEYLRELFQDAAEEVAEADR